MIILGIDPGVALTGWGVVEKKDEPELVAYGCIKTSKSQSSEKRLAEIYQELQKLIKKYQPRVVCLEKVFFNVNAKTALAVGEARGVIKICAALRQLPVAEFTPLQIKDSIAGYGRAEKRQIQQMVKTLLNLDKIPKPDDAADAIATALTYCFYNQELEGQK